LWERLPAAIDADALKTDSRLEAAPTINKIFFCLKRSDPQATR
jgi:hypothetical protein